MRQEEWAHAELTYGLVRPDSAERVIYVHRQTNDRFAIAPHTWDPIPVGHNWVPGEILADIARWYNDIFDQWEDISWWLCRVHGSSMASRNPIFARVNYVLVNGDDFLLADQCPHGLVELVFAENQFLFPTYLPRWMNWPILQAFLEPMCPRTHFGICMYGLLDGARLGHRLVACVNGFFIQVHFDATPFLLTELYNSAPLHAVTLHTATGYPMERDVRLSVVYIPGGNTLIFSRYYKRVDVDSRVVLDGCLRKRFTDLANENFGLVLVHVSAQWHEPVVNLAKRCYVLVFIDEDLLDAVVLLKLDLPPYHGIGAIFAPKVLDKTSLVMQTGIDLVCGPEGELCACYHNGWELTSGVDNSVDDGDFLVCWLGPEVGVSMSERTVGVHLSFPVVTSANSSGGGCDNVCGVETDFWRWVFQCSGTRLQ